MRPGAPAVLALAAALCAPLRAGPADAQDCDPSQAPAQSSALSVTINPEERVSVSVGDRMPAVATAGTPLRVPVRITNQGFATCRLEVRIVGVAPRGASASLSPEPLRGVPEETRTLTLLLANPGPADLTLSFEAHGVAPYFGGNNRVHFMVNAAPAGG